MAERTVQYEGYDAPGGRSLYDFTAAEQTRFQKLANDLEIDIHVKYCGGAFQEPMENVEGDEQKLYLYDYGSANPTPQSRGMDYLYEGNGDAYARLNYRYVLNTSGEMEEIQEYSGGGQQAAGEFQPYHIWYVVALKNLVGSQARFNRYVTKYAKRAKDADWFEKQQAEQETQTKKAFMEHMKRVSGNQVGTQKRRIQTLEQTMSTLQQQQIDTYKQLEEGMDRLNYLEQLKEQKDAFFEEQIMHLSEHVDFDKVIYNQRTKSLDLYTKLLFLYSPSREKRTPLGRMKIAFNIENRQIRITNLTNKRGGRDHPHVEAGNPCWGHVQPNVTELAAKADLISLFSYVIGYLETYNPNDSWGGYAAYWFDAQKVATETLCEDNVYRNDQEKKAWEERGKTEEVVQTEEVESALTGMLDTAVAAVSDSEMSTEESA